MSVITQISLINSTNEYQEYSELDNNLIPNFEINELFGTADDYIEYFIYSLNKELLYSKYDSSKYTPSQNDASNNTYSTVSLDPESDTNSFGIDRGSVIINYNFYKKLFKSDFNNRFWIKEISGTRTEIRIIPQHLSNDELAILYQTFTISNSGQPYYYDFLLNFSDNKTIIVTNVLYDIDDDGNGSLLIKLYQPLPGEFDLKNTLWVSKRVSNPLSYNVSFLIDQETQREKAIPLRGPNFSVNINSQVGQNLGTYNYNDLFSTTLTSSFNQIKSLMDDSSYEINVDYADFSNFVHFSSATDRIYNFKYKLQLIESYSADLNNLDSVILGNQNYRTSSSTALSNKITNLIEKFDGYEYYLYYDTGSNSWPKSTTSKPYQLYSVTSSPAINWIGTVDNYTPGYANKLFESNAYDNQNKDWVFNLVPEFIKDDSSNLPYQLFLDMVAQHFDNIWIYYKDVNERFNADNSLNSGVSKDVVSNALKALGIKLYTNTNISNNIYYSLLGYNSDGQNSLPTGSEVINYYISSSLPISSADDITSEYYKRIYHNIPYLLKTKGTERGLRALINCFGVPDTILRINEFGGFNTDTLTRQTINRFSLAYENTPNQCITLPWDPSYYTYLYTGNANIVPDTIEFRFKTKGIPTASYYYSQSLFQVGKDSNFKFGVNLTYNPTQSILTSSYQNYGNATLHLNGIAGVSSSVPLYLPFFDTNMWWSVMIKRQNGGYTVAQNDNLDNIYWLYIKGTLLNEEGINTIAFEASSSIVISGTTQPTYNSSWITFDPATCSTFNAYLGGTGSFSGSTNILAPTGSQFNGYFQEFRYWNTPLSENAFNTHVLNSLSYLGNSISSSLFELIFRAPLGNNLNVPYKNESTPAVEVNLKDYDLYDLGITTISSQAAVTSYHPAVTGSFYNQYLNSMITNVESFINGGSPFGYGLFSTNNSRNFVNQEFAELISSPSTGIGDIATNKVLVINNDPLNISASVFLSPYVSSQIYPTNVLLSSNDIEVGFSPSDQINEDIINQYGNFDIAQYIGGTDDLYNTKYPNLESLSEEYFQKYFQKYNVTDLLRIVKYLDNSLFKFLKDFVPAKANTSAGIIIKPHILSRSKYKRVDPETTLDTFSGSISSGSISGGSGFGRSMNTAYTASVLTPYGLLNVIKSTNVEVFNGQFSGSFIDVVDMVFTTSSVSSVTPTDSNWKYVTIPINYLQNNFTASVRSKIFYDLDYTYNQLNPVNYGIITQSIKRTSSLWYNDSGVPYAEVQDYYYVLKRHTLPRYEGVKVQSQVYNEYSAGDNAYGNASVIDLTTDYFAYLVDIYTSSLTMPSRSNAQIKYLIDKNSSVIDLSSQNTNIFDIQNIYKSGQSVNISLFDSKNKASNIVDKRLTLYEGGYKHFPIYYNLSGAILSNQHSFTLTRPLIVDLTITGRYDGNANFTASDPAWQSSNYVVKYGAVGYAAGANNLSIPISITRPAPYPTQTVTASLRLRTGEITNTLDTTDSSGYDPSAPGGRCAQTCYSDSSENIFQLTNPTFNNGYYILGSVIFTFVGTQTEDYRVITTNTCLSECYDQFNEFSAGNTPLFYTKDTTYGTGRNSLKIEQTKIPNVGETYSSSVQLKITTFNSDTCVDLVFNQEKSKINTIKFSHSISLYSSTDQEFYFDSISDNSTYASNIQNNIEDINRPFSIKPGDLFRFSPNQNFNNPGVSAVNYLPGWNINEEYRVVRTYYSSSITGTDGQYLFVELDKDVNLAVVAGTQGPYFLSGSTVPAKICKFVIVSHVPDETNIVLNYMTTTEDKFGILEGTVYPQYISDLLREKSGNIIKTLKADNLI